MQMNDQKSESQEPQKPGVYIRTFGCHMNEYDSQKLYKILEKDYKPVDAPEKADLVLVNTCSVREKHEQKLYSMLGELKALRSERPGMMIGVCGCVAQQEGEKILKKDRGVDFVFGTHNLSLVPSLIQLRKKGAPPQAAVNYREDWEELPLGFAENDPTRHGQAGQEAHGQGQAHAEARHLGALRQGAGGGAGARLPAGAQGAEALRRAQAQARAGHRLGQIGRAHV